ncbi:hypothetical protein [Rhizobium rhizogenes]|uniref:hypothetical protein n=1 Tax=Rhizobium rhizogenes TaxID=359 RepID=UPI0024BE8B23|nr:hypothetical protein [Rhizobium rhizogenes]MDJ1632290.1 hypothetical protein [Rhizobium rhizogenes]
MVDQSIGALASKIVDRWSWWRAALKNPAAIGKTLPVHDGDAQQGYYRAKNRDKTFDPVAIFYPEGSDDLVAYRSGREVRADEVWSFCCRYPVTFEAYTAATEGKGWPDDDATVAAQIKAPEPGIGDNSAPVDEAETINDQIENALKGMTAYEKITDDETAAKAQSLRNRLNELSNDADKKRDALKRPHLDAGTAIDKKWMPLVKNAKAGADRVKTAMEAWETEKLRLRREQERKKAEEDRIAAEKAAANHPGETAVIEAPAPVSRVEAAPAPIRATYGKSASVKATIIVDQVTDWPALAVYMSNHQECQELLRKLAQRALDAGRENIPGITTTEAAKVR